MFTSCTATFRTHGFLLKPASGLLATHPLLSVSPISLPSDPGPGSQLTDSPLECWLTNDGTDIWVTSGHYDWAWNGTHNLGDIVEQGSRRSPRVRHCPQPTDRYNGREKVPHETRGGEGIDVN
jgi:hypothetical protein